MFSMATVVRPYKGVSADERRAERRERLVQACLEVIALEGVQGCTVERVSTAAQLTKRYFYESFADRDAILLAAADELFGLVRSRVEAELPRHRSRPARTRAVLAVLIDTLSDDPRLARLYVECPGYPVLLERREQEIAAFTDFIATAVLGDGTDAARVLAARVLVAGTTDVVTSWLAGTLETDRESVIATLEKLAAAV